MDDAFRIDHVQVIPTAWPNLLHVEGHLIAELILIILHLTERLRLLPRKSIPAPTPFFPISSSAHEYCV